jgi:hypothetical protein
MDFREFWVSVPETNERDAPDGVPVNRIFRGQRLVVHEQHDGWGRVTADGFDARWVRMNALERSAIKGDFANVPSDWIHPAIQSLPTAATDGLSLEDIQYLWAGANFIFDMHTDSVVVDGDRSTTRVDSYYVTLEPGFRSEYFKRADAIDWQLANSSRGH